jgi:serine/threonine protein kinase
MTVLVDEICQPMHEERARRLIRNVILGLEYLHENSKWLHALPSLTRSDMVYEKYQT